jgi:hypothetical protein
MGVHGKQKQTKMKTTELIRERLEAHGNKHQLTIDWEKFDAILAEAEALERENTTLAYSEGWRDGQDVIIAQIKHIDKGGDALGHQFYAAL